MGSLSILNAIATGGDIAQIAIFVMLFKHHTRLTKIETRLEGHD